MRYGVYTGLVLVALSLVLYLTGMSEPGKSGQQWIGIGLTIIIIAGGMVIACRAHRDEELGGVMSFGRGFGVSMLVSIAATLISSVYTFIFLQFIDTSMIQKLKDAQIHEMERRGMNDDQIEAAQKFSEMIFNPGALSLIGFIQILIFTLIVALIVSAIMQKKSL